MLSSQVLFLASASQERGLVPTEAMLCWKMSSHTSDSTSVICFERRMILCIIYLSGCSKDIKEAFNLKMGVFPRSPYYYPWCNLTNTPSCVLPFTFLRRDTWTLQWLATHRQPDTWIWERPADGHVHTWTEVTAEHLPARGCPSETHSWAANHWWWLTRSHGKTHHGILQ